MSSPDSNVPKRILRRWSVEDDAAIASLYRDKSHADIAVLIGRTRNAVRDRCHNLGLRTKETGWTEAEYDVLRARCGKGVKLDMGKLAAELGRTKEAICIKISRIGLGDKSRPLVERRKIKKAMFSSKEERSAYVGSLRKAWIAKNGHPRGALGMKHTEETKRIVGEKSRANWAAMTEDKKQEMIMKSARTRVANGNNVPERPNASWKAGWREIGGVRKYYRSKWEANYARYLEWLKEKKQIADWKHEPKTFWFEGIKRGTLSYLPDFWVQELSGVEAFHEVKGWMDDRSKTKIARMGRYYPSVKLVVIREKEYNEIKRKIASMIQGWEA